MKYDKNEWHKHRHTYEHISGKITIRPNYSNTQQIVYYTIFFYKGDGFIRELDRVQKGVETVKGTINLIEI